MEKRGFSLIESLTSMTLSLLMLAAVFEAFAITRNFFLSLKKSEEETLAVMACLDKMRFDLQRAGAGLSGPIRHGLIESLSFEGKKIVILSLEESYKIAADLPAGATRINLAVASEVSRGRNICLYDGKQGECKLVSSCPDNKTIILTTALEHSYSKDETRLLLLEKVTFYLEESKSTLRRQVNASSPQPLLEEVASFDCLFNKENNLFAVRLALISNREKNYELNVFPKNTAPFLQRF